MRRLSCLIFLFLCCSSVMFAQSAKDSIALATAKWDTTDLAGGGVCRYAQVDMFGSRQSISVVSYPARKYTTSVLHLDRQVETTSWAATAHDAKVAINGSYFNMKTLEPVTFVMVDGVVLGRTVSQELFRTNGVVAFRDEKGRKMDIILCDTTEYAGIARRYRSVIAGGPVLVLSGTEMAYDSQDGFYTGRHPRSVIGKDKKGSIIMLVIDGRHEGEAAGASIAEAAYIARQLGMADALNLDGGGSSALWMENDGVISYPSDNRVFDHEGERPVPNFIITRQK